MKYKYDILENTSEGIVKVDEKEVYNLDSGVEDAGKWLRKDAIKDTVFLECSSSLNIKSNKGNWTKDAIGYLQYHNNNVAKNATSVGLYTMSYSNQDAGFPFTKSNFHKAITGFCVRRLIQSNVWNDKDEYMKPSDSILNSDEYKQWNNDCIVYSLFDNQSFQSSLRQVDYQSKKWDIINEFFWLSSSKMRELAESVNWIEMIDDIDENGTKERFVYQEIERIKNLTDGTTFSDIAIKTLDCATKLIEDSMVFRKQLSESKEEYHLKSWDCGFAQVKLVWKQYMKEEFKEFDVLRKQLGDSLRENVYNFGFLYR